MAKTVIGGGRRVFNSPRGRWLVGAFAVLGTSVLAYALSPGLRTNLGDLVALGALLGEAYATGIKEFVLSFGAFSPIAYFFAMIAQVFIAPVPSAPVSLAGSLIFGVWEGFGLSLAGSIVGSVLAFLAARRWGGPLVARLVGREAYARYAGNLDRRGLWLFAVLLVPFMPDDAAVALAGLSRIPFRWFLPVMVAGRVPFHATTALLTSESVTGSATGWITAGVAIAAVLALTLAYRGRLKSRVLQRAGDGRADAGSTAAVPHSDGAFQD